MKQEVSLCLVRHSKAVLVWEASKLDHTAKEVLMAYTTEKERRVSPSRLWN